MTVSRSSFRLGLEVPPEGNPGDPGLFGPGSEVWNVGRERVLLAAGPAALLLQVTHPLVAAGVAQHSDFRRDPFQRLRATLDATLRVSFGDHPQADAAAARVASTHRRVRGTLTERAGRFPAGTAYDAFDPVLGMWVHATLVWSALAAYDRLVEPLDRDRRSRYYEEAKRFAGRFGVTDQVMPATLAGFEAYVDATMAEDLSVGDRAGSLARDILRPPVPMPVRLGLPAVRALTAELLPEPVRAAYGLGLGAMERSLSGSVRRAVRATVHRWPPSVRFWPHYLVAVRRAASMSPYGSDPTKEAG